MNLLISGVSGFLGSHLAKALGKYYCVLGVVGKSGRFVNVAGIPIYNPDELQQIRLKPDAVVMCHAAVASGQTKIPNNLLYEANILFTETLLKAFPKAYFIFISTVSVYGQSRVAITEVSNASPSNEYSISKLWAEKLVLTFGNNAILRVSSLYGPGMKNITILPEYVHQALTKKIVNVWGSGERKQNYLYVGDVVQYVASMLRYKPTGTYLATSNTHTSNIELANIVACETGAEIMFSGEDCSPSAFYDNSYTKRVLQIDFETDLISGVKEYISWIKGRC